MADGTGTRRADAARLYDTFGASLYRYALMVLADAAAAEDVVQQVFTAVVHGSRSLQDPERYLRRAVRNECYTVLRQRVRTTEIAADWPCQSTRIRAIPSGTQAVRTGMSSTASATI